MLRKHTCVLAPRAGLWGDPVGHSARTRPGRRGGADARCPALLTLSVVGRVELIPADLLDPQVAGGFDAHQRRATDRGRLLGPDAVAFAVKQFGQLGRGPCPPSPWRLGALEGEWRRSGSPGG
jgi:hypothetical protein